MIPIIGVIPVPPAKKYNSFIPFKKSVLKVPVGLLKYTEVPGWEVIQELITPPLYTLTRRIIASSDFLNSPGGGVFVNGGVGTDVYGRVSMS